MSQNQSHITAGGQPPCPSWCLAPPGAYELSHHLVTRMQIFPPSRDTGWDSDCNRLYICNLYTHIYIQCK